MRARSLADSFRYAVDGLVYSLRTQRNMRIHFMVAFSAISGAVILHATRTEVLILVLMILVVILAEMFNTAVEATVDLITGTYHPLARIAKNVAAGAVLVTAVGAIIVGFTIFGPKLLHFSQLLAYGSNKASLPTLVLVVGFVMLSVLSAKTFMPASRILAPMVPSGFTALAFSTATWIAYRSVDGMVVILGFFLAVVVGFSRLEYRARSILEVFSGAIFGIIVSYVICRLTL